MIEFPCPNCQQPLQSDPGTEGAFIGCPYCSFQVQVPEASAPKGPDQPAVVPPEISAQLPAGATELGTQLSVHLQTTPAHPPTGSWLSFFRRPAMTGSVVVFEKGFVVLGHGNAGICRWDEIGLVTETPKVAGAMSGAFCEVRTIEDTAFRFDDSVANLTALASAIVHHSAPFLVPWLKTWIDRGGGYRFGIFRLTMHGLERGSSVLRWDFLRSVSKTTDTLAVRRWGSEVPWSECDPRQAGSLDLFIFLANSIAAAHRDVLR